MNFSCGNVAADIVCLSSEVTLAGWHCVSFYLYIVLTATTPEMLLKFPAQPQKSRVLTLTQKKFKGN